MDHTDFNHVPYWKEGSGYYTDSVLGCFDVIKGGTAMALEGTKLTNDGSFVVCDYGSNDGGTSMLLMKEIISKLKSENGDDQEVHIIYEDQPTNDFKSLFLRVHGLAGFNCYTKEFKNVYVTASGTGFYRQVLPRHTVDLGLSFTAVNWLSKRPCDLTECFHHTLCNEPSEQKLWREQAAKDWQKFLLLRAKELKPGQYLVISALCIDDLGQFNGNTNRIKESSMYVMNTHWKAMKDEGIITEKEFIATTVNEYFRNKEDLLKPFNDSNSEVVKAGLKLLKFENNIVECPYQNAWVKSGQTAGDPIASRAHAQWFMPAARVWSDSTFRSALTDSRSDLEKNQIVDEIFKRYEDDVAKAPQDHAIDSVIVYMQIMKNN